MPKLRPDIYNMNGLFAEMVLDKAVRQFRKKQLLQEIDRALDNEDKQAFILATTELISLTCKTNLNGGGG